jgi:hypothetical protein
MRNMTGLVCHCSTVLLFHCRIDARSYQTAIASVAFALRAAIHVSAASLNNVGDQWPGSLYKKVALLLQLELQVWAL